jgi:thymidylate kinase
MLKHSYLICLIGIDGAGKTTLARKLNAEINHKGIKSKYVMSRFESFKLLSPFRWAVKKAFLAGKRTDQSLEGVKTKKKLFKNRFLAKIWRQALLTDYMMQLCYKVRLALLKGTSVCADRYAYDTAVDLAADLALSAPDMLQLLDRMLRWAPKPDLVFLIDLTGEIAYERNLAKHDELPLEYFLERRGLFLTFKTRPEVVVLDGSQKPDEIFRLILNKLKEKQILF